MVGVVDLPTAEDLDRALGGLPIIREMGAGMRTEALPIYDYRQFAHYLAEGRRRLSARRRRAGAGGRARHGAWRVSRRPPAAAARACAATSRRLASRRRTREAFVGFVARRTRGTSSARASRAASRSSASARLRAWPRASWATARTTGPQRAVTRAFCASSSVADDATSKLASIRDSVLLACWPPGPDERLAWTVDLVERDRTSRLIVSISAIGHMMHAPAW